MNTQQLPIPSYYRVYEPYSQQYDIKNFFSLSITQRKKSTRIVMQLMSQEVNTETIPMIVDLLEEYLPAVLETTCYNENNLPFHLEVRNTEFGHLFEHILLEYLCQLKIAKGAPQATYVGRTKWNWYRDPKGRFHINLSCGQRDSDILPQALDKTVALMQTILAYNQPMMIQQLPLMPATNGLKNGSQSTENK